MFVMFSSVFFQRYENENLFIFKGNHWCNSTALKKFRGFELPNNLSSQESHAILSLFWISFLESNLVNEKRQRPTLGCFGTNI